MRPHRLRWLARRFGALCLAVAVALTATQAGAAVEKKKNVQKKPRKVPTAHVAPRATYAEHPSARAFIEEMVRDHGFERDALARLLATVKRNDRVIELMDAPTRRQTPWHEYAARFLTEERINEGVAFAQANREALRKAEVLYGIPPALIAAIVGIETFYGRITGSFSVLEALATLAFDYPRRADFFRMELKHFLLLNRERPNVALTAKGSYAGAMGVPQFMPGSYLNYAVDFDNDARIDLWGSAPDIVGSVANYFVRHGWKSGQPVWSEITNAEPSKLPALDGGLSLRQPLGVMRSLGLPIAPELGDDEEAAILMLEEADGPRHFVAYHNWFVITRYNRSRLYASAVWSLAEAIRARN